MSQAINRIFGPDRDARRPKPPAHLSTSAKRWWRSLVEGFDLESHHVVILTAAAEALDRKVEARRVIAEEGLVIRSGTGTPISHPAVQIEDAAAVRMAHLIREIGLDGAPGPDGRGR